MNGERPKIDMGKYARPRDTGGGYRCPRCGAVEWRGEQHSEVESTRHPNGSVTTRRRRVCQCGQHTFTTFETIVPEGCELKVVPADEDEESEAA